MDQVRVTLQKMDGEKGGSKLSTVYTRIKKIINVELTLTH
jgi:hypothetical protein